MRQRAGLIVAHHSLLALAIVVGTYKAGETLRKLKTDLHRWAVLAIMAVTTIFCAIPALALDLYYKDSVLRAGRSIEYPETWHQELISAHIWERDFRLLIPLIIVAFLRFFREIERINLEERGRVD